MKGRPSSHVLVQLFEFVTIGRHGEVGHPSHKAPDRQLGESPRRTFLGGPPPQPLESLPGHVRHGSLVHQVFKVLYQGSSFFSAASCAATLAITSKGISLASGNFSVPLPDK